MTLEKELESQNTNREKCHAEELDVVKDEIQTLKQLYAQLKTYCDTTSNVVNEEEIRKQTEKVFAGYFGDGISKDDVARLFHTMNSKMKQEEPHKSNSVVGTSRDEPEKASSKLGIDEIRRIVLDILKIYDADKTGRVDYALESAGKHLKFHSFILEFKLINNEEWLFLYRRTSHNHTFYAKIRCTQARI